MDRAVINCFYSLKVNTKMVYKLHIFLFYYRKPCKEFNFQIVATLESNFNLHFILKEEVTVTEWSWWEMFQTCYLLGELNGTVCGVKISVAKTRLTKKSE